MSRISGDGGSRVSIPADLLQTIQNIREVTGKQHSDEDIFSVFKECFSDPHETTQKLLYLDTFHEVRSKRERKKENLVPNTQGRGRTGRKNFASSYTGHCGLCSFTSKLVFYISFLDSSSLLIQMPVMEEVQLLKSRVELIT
jgi:hypothetical protein